MTGYRVDLPSLQQLIDSAAALETRIEERLAAIDRRVDQLHVSWSGEAAESHAAAYAQWVAGVDEMRQALKRLRAYLHTAHGAYHGARTVNRVMWPQ